ncbi:hypothetical protein B9Z55_015355 [Caenorhabditis nigoni]|uniref:DUF38 domain-containing protein n=1 Tax=Caenorhabditis nigoni TaxID=1611254 RepID=A0A2G5UA31_9PELO|nr:hypothetical protein B9Z55_015355 [Caenorhabditis nigoni]
MALSKPSINMTADLLRIIVRQCEYPAIQILRKTSATVRDLVDRRLPDGSVYSISIKSCTNSIFFEIKSGNPNSPSAGQLYPRGNRIKIEYQFHKNGCMVILERRGGRKSQRLVRDESFENVFWKDFESLLDTNQGKVLEDFKINFEMIEWGKKPKKYYYQFIAQLEEVIKRRGYLKTKNVSLKIFREPECRNIFALMDPNHLEGIHFCSIEIQEKSNLIAYSRYFATYEMEKLDQWKNAKTIQLENLRILHEEHFFHFERVKIHMSYISEQDIDGVVQAFFTSTIPTKHFTIVGYGLESFTGEDYLEMYESSNERKVFLQSDLSENIVEVFFSPNSFQIRLVKNSDVPPGFIQDWVPWDNEEEDVDDSDNESDDDEGSDDEDF